MNNRTYSLGILDVAFIVLLILKLTGLLTWSWWLITSPIWVGLLLVIFLIIVGVWRS